MENNEAKIDREVLFRLIKYKGNNAWMAMVQEDGKWVALRPSKTTFESVQSSLFDEAVHWAFPHYRGARQK
jgi:hypothetical protein